MDDAVAVTRIFVTVAMRGLREAAAASLPDVHRIGCQRHKGILAVEEGFALSVFPGAAAKNRWVVSLPSVAKGRPILLVDGLLETSFCRRAAELALGRLVRRRGYREIPF